MVFVSFACVEGTTEKRRQTNEKPEKKAKETFKETTAEISTGAG